MGIAPDVAEASSGMYAFGDLLLFVGVAGVVALVPTVALIRMLTRTPSIQEMVGWAALLVSTTSALSAAAIIGRLDASEDPSWSGIGLLSSLRLIFVPVSVLFLFVGALAMPSGGAKRRCWFAAVLEAASILPLLARIMLS
ncbi:MAG: hypothetical protein EXR51_07840 [Dehalococcoidia bacterium]|nr:hypothetical protein [Dehalococcoidia bacterium]